MTLPRIGGSRQASRIARRLSAYIPRSVTTRQLRGEAVEPGREKRLEAAALFLDISGFSTMANELATDGPRGAEELNRLLLMTFTAMINAIHGAGGFVSHFHGDGLMVCFEDDDGQGAFRALACGQFMQNLMGGAYSRMVANRPHNQTTVFNLSMKIGVGYGRCLEIVVGERGEGMEYVLAGPAVDEAVAAEGHARAGQVIASRAALLRAGLPAIAPYQPLTASLPVPFTQNTIHWDAYTLDVLWDLSALASEFVPRSLWDRIVDDANSFVAEHRPVTSIFVRFEGIDYDRAEAAEKLQAYYRWAQRIVAGPGRGNSHINRILTGDTGSLLHILFGAPVAPDAPEEALRCALQLQRERPSFVTRQQIGLAAGMAFACPVGSQNRREYTIVGDVVNLSARLMGHCADRQILLDGATAARVQDQVGLRAAGRVTLKGFPEPVPIFELVSEKLSSPAAQSRYSREQRPLIGRQEQEILLQEALRRTLDGEDGAALITGSTSKEQTRLVSSGARTWQEADGEIFVGVGQEHLSELPFGIWQSIWRGLFELREGDSLEQQAAVVGSRLEVVCPEKMGDLPLLEPLLAIPLPVRRDSLIGLGTVEKQTRLFDLLRHCLLDQVRRRPLLLILENLHWADQSSLALLHHLVNHLRGTRTFILATSGELTRFKEEQLPALTRIELPDISVQQGRTLVQQYFNDQTIPAGLYEHLGLRRDQGLVNPHLIEENIHRLLATSTLLNNGRLALDHNRLADQPMSGDLHSHFLTQLDRLSTQARSFLQAASVLGVEFDLEVLKATILPLPAAALDGILEELVEAELLFPQPQSQKYLFQDEQVQEAAYHSIPYGRRQKWHALIADWLADRPGSRPALDPIVAFHYSRTDLHERAVTYALRAGDQTRSTTPRTAVQLLSLGEPHLKALGEAERWPEALALYSSRAELYWVSEQYEAAAADARRAEKLALQNQQHEALARIANLRGRIELRRGNANLTLKQAAYVCDHLASRIPPVLTGQALANRAAAAFYSGEFAAGLKALAAAEPIFQDADFLHGQARVLLLRGYEWLLPRGEWEEARGCFTAAEALVPRTGEHSVENHIRTLIGLAQVDFQAGALEQAAAHLNTAAEISAENGLQWWNPAIFRGRAAIHREAGQLARANSLLEKGVRTVRQGGNPNDLPLLLLDLARLMPNPVLRLPLLEECQTALNTRCRAVDREPCLAALQEMGVPL